MNLAHAIPARPRARALALRAEATTAREALEVSDVDRAGFDYLCQRLHDTEQARTTAERAAEEHPKQREREAAARVDQARAEAISGTWVVVSEDRATVTRMAHCESCKRMAELLGDPTRLWERGWASRRETDKPGWPRLWFCPDCWKVEAPRILRAGPPLLIPPARLRTVIEVSRMRAHAKRRLRLQEQIRQLLVVDPDLGEAVLRTVVYAAESKHAARQWRRLLPEASLRLGAGTAPTRDAAAPSGDLALDAGPEPSEAAALDADAEPGGPAPAPSQDPRRAETEPAGSADAEVLTAALYALAAAEGIPLKADSKELLAAFRASSAEHGEVLLVDGMPDPTFTDKWTDLGGEELLAPASKNPGRPS